MSLTAEEVRVKLGLRPWDEQARDFPSERSGKTTRMQCQMLADASEGKKLFLVAVTVGYARQIVDGLRRMADVCGVKVDVTVISRDRDLENARFSPAGTVRGLEKGTYSYHWDHSIAFHRRGS